MSTPSEKLAESLDLLHKLQKKGKVVLRSADMTRTHRERLKKNGFLRDVIKGWYIPSSPDEKGGESTTWYTTFWQFCSEYLSHLKGNKWVLSPEQSLSLHAENKAVPRQLLIRSEKARNNITHLPFETSLLDIRSALPTDANIIQKDGLRIYNVPAALIACSPGFFRQNPTDVRSVLAMVQDASQVLEKLLDGGHSAIAGRLAGAFRNIGRDKIADDIVQTMRAAGYSVREDDPFEAPSPILFTSREQSPYVNRIRLMWKEMRGVVLENFPAPTGISSDREGYLKQVEDIYVTDAYHSLSIEGYRVSRELIERVRSGNWNPDFNQNDAEDKNALAARGYWLAHEAVKKSIRKILAGENPGSVIEQDLSIWYRELFAPSVTAGISRASDLAGFRNQPVYIRNSKHVPPNVEAVRDAIPALYELLKEEEEPSVRVVLGHFIFVYIHPYRDGNGRIGRFLMNAMLASGGYPWTVITLEQRNAYMAALEQASVHQNITPFTKVIAASIGAVK